MRRVFPTWPRRARGVCGQEGGIQSVLSRSSVAKPMRWRTDLNSQRRVSQSVNSLCSHAATLHVTRRVFYRISR